MCDLGGARVPCGSRLGRALGGEVPTGQALVPLPGKVPSGEKWPSPKTFAIEILPVLKANLTLLVALTTSAGRDPYCEAAVYHKKSTYHQPPRIQLVCMSILAPAPPPPPRRTVSSLKARAKSQAALDTKQHPTSNSAHRKESII